MTRRAATRSAPESDAITIESPDGVLTLRLKRHGDGVLMERVHRLPSTGSVMQAMQFEHEAGFLRWCEGDPLRHAYPLLFSKLRRSVDVLFRPD